MEGEGYIQVNERDYYPQPGQLILLPAGMRQSYSTISEHTYKKYWCHFTAHIGELSLFHLLKVSPVITLQERDRERVQQKFVSLIEQHQSSSWTSVVKQQAVMLDLIAFFLEQQPQDQIALTYTGTVEKIERILHHNRGQSPIQYINRKKIEKSREQLTTTDRSIANIAEDLAIQPHYFARLFKQLTGQTPSEFRSHHQHDLGRNPNCV